MARRIAVARSCEADELEAMLAPFTVSQGPRYRTAAWLRSDFYDDVWTIASNRVFQVDWRVRLPDGNLLPSPPHAKLCNVFKSWLIARSHVDSTGNRWFCPQAERNILLQRPLHCMDYLLLHAEPLGLVEHGLGALTQNDLCAMLASIGSSRTIHNSVYGWSSRLTVMLRTKIAAMTRVQFRDAQARHAGLDEHIPDQSTRSTTLSEEEIIASRAWLAANGLFVQGNGYRLSPNTARLADELYGGTLCGRSLSLPMPEELCIGPDFRAHTEYPRAFVRSENDERRALKSLLLYVDAVKPLNLLRADGLPAPSVDADAALRFARTLDTKPMGRFRTVAPQVVLDALRKAVEFTLDHGDDLVDSYVALARAARAAGQTVAAFAACHGVGPSLTPHCRAMGVRSWTIEPINAGLNGGAPLLPADRWYENLRSNHGLYESLRVLYGAIKIVVGTLTARRQGELMDLVAESCLDAERTRLVFKNRKSGPGGLRETEARPIPPIGVRLIGLLERLQKNLIHIEALKEADRVFAPPRRLEPGLVVLTFAQYNADLDLFSDWAQTPVGADGRRIYIRQHQLRRFFAMVFFYGGGFGGMDTLRWFLGHTDVQHLWHYITETTPGAMLRSVAAEWAAYGVKHATPEAEALSEEVFVHFGTRDFSVLDDEALTVHIEDLIEEGRLTVQPEFLDGGRQYRVAVQLRKKDSI